MVGRRGGGTAESTTLVERDGEVAGSFVTAEGAYRIVPLGSGLQALVTVDPSKFPKDEPDSFRAVEVANLGTPAAAPAAPSNTSPIEIDVLVAYTPAAKAKVADVDLTIDEAIAEANQAFQLSDVHIHMNRVDSFEFPYVEKNKSYGAILDAFSKSPLVGNRRTQSGADLAALLVDQPEYCGLSQSIPAKASTAFSVVHFDCAIFPRYSLAHEFGHLLGGRHELSDDNTPGYAHGSQYTRGNTPWATIMVYNCTCMRIQHFSNPRILYDGVPTGTPDHNDNARALNENAPMIAAFRSRPGTSHTLQPHP